MTEDERKSLIESFTMDQVILLRDIVEGVYNKGREDALKDTELLKEKIDAYENLLIEIKKTAKRYHYKSLGDTIYDMIENKMREFHLD